VRPVNERTLEMVKKVYLEYWVLHSGIWNNPRNLIMEISQCTQMMTRRAKGNYNWCRIQGHKLADCNKDKVAEKNSREGVKLMDD